MLPYGPVEYLKSSSFQQVITIKIFLFFFSFLREIASANTAQCISFPVEQPLSMFFALNYHVGWLRIFRLQIMDSILFDESRLRMQKK